MDRLIDDERNRKLLIKYIQHHELPFTCAITKGRHRSVEQNRLAFLWYNEIAQQKGDMTPDEVRGMCKLQFGVPILRLENEKFREAYDRLIKPLPYETKVAYMSEPLNFPVTSLMTSKQKADYLDAFNKFFTEQGLQLTRPDGLEVAA